MIFLFSEVEIKFLNVFLLFLYYSLTLIWLCQEVRYTTYMWICDVDKWSSRLMEGLKKKLQSSKLLSSYCYHKRLNWLKKQMEWNSELARFALISEIIPLVLRSWLHNIFCLILLMGVAYPVVPCSFPVVPIRCTLSNMSSLHLVQ